MSWVCARLSLRLLCVPVFLGGGFFQCAPPRFTTCGSGGMGAVNCRCDCECKCWAVINCGPRAQGVERCSVPLSGRDRLQLHAALHRQRTRGLEGQ